MSGYKTYLTAGLIAVATFAKAVGWLDSQQFETVLGILGALGLGFLRAGVEKSGPDG